MAIKLSKADKTILTNIEYNPRITNKRLAELCHLSNDGVKYRLRRLERIGVIAKYGLFIDHKKLGHQFYKLYLSLNCTSAQKNELKEFFRKQPNTFALYEAEGRYLAIAVFTKTAEEFYQIENSMLQRFGNFITKKEFCIMINAELYEKDFIGGTYRPGNFKTHNLWGEVVQNRLDEIDKKLVKILHMNSRAALLNIAKEIGLSFDSTKKRIERLIKNKILAFSRTEFNFELFGYEKYKLRIYPKKFSDQIEKEMMTFLKNKKETINIIRTIGMWKLEVEFLAQNNRIVEAILSELNERFIENIQNLDYSVFRNEEIFACKELLLE